MPKVDSRSISRLLLANSCVELSPKNPFEYASGLRGPLYCDNRRLLSIVDFRDRVVAEFIHLIEKERLEFDIIAGVATAGIPHATLIADRLKRPLIYVRSSAKGHGRNNQIEGIYSSGDRVLLIEDLVNQGESLCHAANALRDHGLHVISALSIVDYQMKRAEELLKRHEISLYSLCNLDTLLDVAFEEDKLEEEEISLLNQWRQNPVKWSDDYVDNN